MSDRRDAVTPRLVFSTWWPLAASWLLMGFELPAVSAVMARLADPELSLAAYGGVVFPLALIIEAPVIMLLAASTSLSRDWISYRKLRRFVWTAAGVLTALHLAVVLTPLWDLVVSRLLGIPDDVAERAWLGMLLMTPWSGSIAYRRFQQGVLIRQGYSRLVGIGTGIRLAANFVVLAVGYWQQWPGIAVGSGAVAAGVLAEAFFIGVRVRPIRAELPAHDPEARPLTRRSFVAFYVPLATTSLLTLLSLPLGSAAMSRMPLAVESLATWPVLNGLTFTLRSLGLAFHEVVVSLLDRPRSYHLLRRFALGLAASATLILAAIAATPLHQLWFRDISALPPELVALGTSALWIALPLPALSVLQSWLSGILVNQHQTRGISEAVAVALAANGGALVAFVQWGGLDGLPAAVTSTLLGLAVQTTWLTFRSRAARARLR